jgi:hypothetical protein
MAEGFVDAEGDEGEEGEEGEKGDEWGRYRVVGFHVAFLKHQKRAPRPKLLF